ncbi:Bromodomain-containing protein [Boletus reticuloceps]|uniref:Bromodomain-containing protein n=1 Tax=Boletus reticuloceps TaxID=495285 RepID=A0A8I2YV25_9AGAM|nr:Bromodomain-containing protein [Boletus reticuloceps]
MDVEEPVVLQEPDKANEKPQQREGKRKIPDSDNLEESQREKKRPREESTSTDVDEQTPRKPSTANSELASHHQTPPSVPNKRFQTVIGMLHSQISQHRNGNIFHNPIKNSEAPDYHDIIKRPMDLKTIKARVKDGIISNSLEFQRDVYLMFANAMMYNRPTSDIYHMAEEMMAESEMHINTFRQTEGFIRSTRS